MKYRNAVFAVVLMVAFSGCVSDKTVRLTDGRCFTCEVVVNDDQRLQFRAKGWEYNLPAYMMATGTVTEPVKVQRVEITKDSIVTPDGRLTTFNELMDFLDKKATRSSPVILVITDAMSWSETRRKDFGMAYDDVHSRPNVGVEGFWPKNYVPEEARQALAPIQSAWHAGKYEEALKQMLLVDPKWNGYFYSIYSDKDFPLAPKITETHNTPCVYIITGPQDRYRTPEISFGFFAPAGVEDWSVVAIDGQSNETVISNDERAGAFLAYYPSTGGLDILGSICAARLKSGGHYILMVRVVEKGGRKAFAQAEIDVKKAAAEQSAAPLPRAPAGHSEGAR